MKPFLFTLVIMFSIASLGFADEDYLGCFGLGCNQHNKKHIWQDGKRIWEDYEEIKKSL